MTSHFRAFVLMLFLEALALSVSTARGLAQEQNAAPTTGGPSATSPPQAATPRTAASAAFDPTAARVKYLHDRLRITPEQEPIWDAVAQAIRDSAQGIVPLLRERFRARTSGSALDVLNSYEALGEAQLDGLKKFIAVFGPLYASLSEGQKKIANPVLREGPLNSMIGGLPEVPAPFGSPLSYEIAVPYYAPSLERRPAVPLFVRHSGAFPHFHGVVSPRRTAIGRFHR